MNNSGSNAGVGGGGGEGDDRPLSWVLRVLDANANRATEGLRVVEEFFRFELQDKSLSHRCKQIRHKVSKTVASIASDSDRAACRSATTDVGVEVEGPNEYQRSSSADVVTSNLQRAKEALRVLEELAKLRSVEAAKQIEAQRYEIYTLEKSLHHVLRAREVIREAQLYVLIDEHFGLAEAFRERVNALIEARVDVIQLRAKSSTDRELVEAGRWLSERCRETDVLFVVNDRADIARAVGAGAVHVGQDELTVADARMVVGPNILVGVSTHSLKQAHQAVRDGADYIGVGPVFASRTKSFGEFAGVELAKQVAGEISLPAFAIGGITSESLATVLSAGATRVAVSNAIWRANDLAGLAEVASKMKQQLVEVAAFN